MATNFVHRLLSANGFRVAAVLVTTALVTGCAGGGPSGGDPGARPLPLGTTCQTLQADLNRMVSRGVQGSIEAQSSGRKLSAQQKSDADRYNALLNQYLGARCHA